VLPRVFLNAWREWQRVPIPMAPAHAGASRRGLMTVEERYERIAAGITELAHAAMGSRQWDYSALAADQLAELHAAEVAIDGRTGDLDAHHAFIAATRSLLAEFGRIP
jgi:hypothetical protein